MQKSFQKFTTLFLTGLLLLGVTTPAAFAKSVSSTASDIDDLTDSVKEMVTSAGGTFDTTAELDTADEVDNFFDELSGYTNEVKSNIRSLARPISQTDFDTIEESYSSFLSKVTSTLSRADTLISATTPQTQFTEDKRDFQNDGSLDDLKTAFESLENNIIGGTTSTGTSSSRVVSVVDDIDTASDNVKDLRTDVDAITNQTLLDSFFESLTNEADDVETALRKITGSITASDYDDLDTSVSNFNDEVTSRFTRLSSRITSSGTGTVLYGLRTSFNDQKGEYQDNQKDDITTQINHITRLATGVSSGSAVINSVISNIEDLQTEVEDLQETDEPGVNTVDELESYFSDIVDRVQDVVREVKKVTGTITQSDFDDLSSAVDDFEGAVDDARNAVKNNISTTDFNREYNSQKSDLTDETDEIDAARDVVEALIGALNNNGGTTTTFIDVLSTSEFARYIAALSSRSIVNGYSDRTFHPKNNVTRAEFLKMALLAANRNLTTYQSLPSTFTDVPLSHSLRQYVNYASANNIVSGQSVGSLRYFYPERPISRAEAMIILLRINLIAPGTSTVSRFSDVRDAEQIRYIEVAATRGIINGYSPTLFGPNDFLSREQAAKIVARINNLAV